MTLPAYQLLEKIREHKPVIHHLTNWVTIFDCAQVVKTLGASPVMAHAKEEVTDMAQIASALVLNIGTLTVEFVESMKIAARSANAKGIPVILDICGAGATRLRDQKCLELLTEVRVDVIKGNASEIARIAGLAVQTRGVDSTEVKVDLALMAQKLALERKATVVITGKEDIVTNGTTTYVVNNGHPMMTSIVGTGCMATSVIGTFCAIEKDLPLAAACGLVCYEIAAELAADESSGPASFKENLFDQLYRLNSETIHIIQKVKA